MAQSPANAAPAETGDDEDTPLGRYHASWGRLNKLMRRGVSWSGGERNAAFVRCADGELDLADAAPVLGLDHPDDGRAAARIDVDFDGDDDLVVTSRTGPRVRILANRWAGGNATLEVRFVGTRSNPEGAGAVVFATPLAEGDAPPEELFRPGTTQRRSRAIGSGFLAQSSEWQRFAFPGRPERGPASRAHLRVRWPGPDGGTVEEFGVVETGQSYVLVEGKGAAQAVRRPMAVVHPEGPLVPETAGSESMRLVLPAPTPIPGLAVRTPEGGTARLFGVTPDGARGAGRPVVMVAWESADPESLERLGDLGALCAAAASNGVGLVALDLSTEGGPGALDEGATRLAAAGWTGDAVAATSDAAIVLRELVAWRFDRTDPPPGPWSLVVDHEGRLAVLRTGPWAEGEFALDGNVLRVPLEQRPIVATLYPGQWIQPPGEADLGGLRGRLVDLGVDATVREIDLARVSTVSIAGADVQIKLGEAQLERGDLAGALERFDAAVERAPDSVLGHRARAYTLHLLKRYEDALAAWSKALRLDPTDLTTRGNRALTAVAAGEVERARADLEVLLESASTDEPIVAAVRRALDLVEKADGND
ncbi:MAG: tetratricopeptide repeat protein [Planctomycetota bacterium]